MDKVLKGLGIAFLGSCIFFLGSCGLLFLAASQTDTSDPVGQPVGEATPERIPNVDVITLAEFNQIQTGMTYEQVVRIVGVEGQVMSENTLPDFEGGQIVTKMIYWENEGFSNANIMIQNGNVISKAQFGLK